MVSSGFRFEVNQTLSSGETESLMQESTNVYSWFFGREALLFKKLNLLISSS